jgi:hypothetical protein
MLINGLRLVHGFFIAHLCLSPPYGNIVPCYLWRTCGEMAECIVGRTVKAMIGCTKQVRTIPRRDFCLLGQLPDSSVDGPLCRMPSGCSGSRAEIRSCRSTNRPVRVADHRQLPGISACYLCVVAEQGHAAKHNGLVAPFLAAALPAARAITDWTWSSAG